MKNNIKNGKYTWMDASGTVQECDIGEHLGVANLGVKDICIEDDPNGLTIPAVNVDFGRNIIIDADSVTFRVGEFELKLLDNILTDELKHTNKIIINGISFIVWFIDFLPLWVKLVTGITAAFYLSGKVLFGVCKFLATVREL